ncbi:MAG: anti-sigma factor family protein, partial [Acetivibrionales bacterium]
MDCRQAWNLMMKGFDKEISQLQEKELNMHLDVCDSCKTRFENLNEAFAALDATDIEAPPDIEKTVMAKLNSVKHKRDFLMPYVISNLIVFVGIIALWLDNIFR